jgi:hypothetical protein
MVEAAADVSLVVPFYGIFLGNMSMIYLCLPRVWIYFALSILLVSFDLSFNVEVLLALPFFSADSTFEFDDPFLLLFEV